MTEQTWPLQEICDVVGTSYRRADYWIRRGYLPITTPFPASGNPRELTFRDALLVQIMTDFTNAGLHPHKVDPVKVIENDGALDTGKTTLRIDLAGVINDLRTQLDLEQLT